MSVWLSFSLPSPSLVSSASSSPMFSPPSLWCVMAPVLSGVWWGPEAGIVGSGAAAATGVASWLGSEQLILVLTLSVLTVLLLVSVLLLLCASCHGWASHTHTQTHTHRRSYASAATIIGFGKTRTSKGQGGLIRHNQITCYFRGQNCCECKWLIY